MIFRKYKNNGAAAIKLKVCYYNGSESPTKKWQAIFLNVGRYSFWVFRNKKVFQGWPSAA